MMKYLSVSQISKRYNVTRQSITNWIKEGRFTMPLGVEGNPTHQNPKGRWSIALPAVLEMDRKLIVDEGAVKVIVPAPYKVVLQSGENIITVAVSLMRLYGGTITVNHKQKTAMFYGIDRQSALPYDEVVGMIESGNLILWNKDIIHGEYYWPAPEYDMVVR